MSLTNHCYSRKHLTLYFAIVLCVAGIACGDDTGDKQPTTVILGSGGGAGYAGTVGSPVAGAPALPGPVPCGSSVCTPRPSPLTALLGPVGMGAAVPALPMPVACCLDVSTGACGTAAAEGAMCEVPAAPDTRCPGFDLGALSAAASGGVAGLGNLMQGCCTPAGMCGLDGSIFGRGCVENGAARSMLSAIPVVGTLLMVPPPLMCNRPLEDDAGAGDAGI
jgi:hypothetical protein